MSEPDRQSQAPVVLRAENLSREVADKSIVKDVSFDVRTGDLLGIVGASGSGKSSLLRLLNRLDEPTQGTVYLDGQDYRQLPPQELRRRVGMVTQRPYLFPGDVASNLRFGPSATRRNDFRRGDSTTCSNKSDFPGSPRRTCRCFRVANSNESPWRERWPTARRCSSSTSRRLRSTSNRNWESKIWSQRWFAITDSPASW